MTIDVRLLQAADARLLGAVADDVFDKPVRPDQARVFLADPRHHIAAALDDGRVVGFASAVHYLHPDKPPELWINEVGVASGHQRRGVGQALVDCLLAHARRLGCAEAWVLTEPESTPARALYRAAGGTESDPVVMVTFRLSEPA